MYQLGLILTATSTPIFDHGMAIANLIQILNMQKTHNKHVVMAAQAHLRDAAGSVANQSNSASTKRVTVFLLLGLALNF